MRAGKRRADAQRRRDAVKRVRAFNRWSEQAAREMAAGASFVSAARNMPPLPTDHEYRIARGDA